jgi:hypothetical protein
MEITDSTIESFYNLIRNWDSDAKRRLVNRINASKNNDEITMSELLLSFNECNTINQPELMLDDVCKN